MISRRKFIKNTGILSATVAFMPSIGCNAVFDQNDSMNFILKGFDDEQEEYPSLVGNRNGEMWMFALRRLSYPEDNEVVSAFKFIEQEWIEIGPVTKQMGQYEAPTASCAVDGKPVVAWTEVIEDNWLINTATLQADGISNPFIFNIKSGKSINPVLISPDKNRNWIAWENFYEGKLSIYLSKFEKGYWSDPVRIDKGNNNCFDPAIAEAKNGDLHIAYGYNEGFHQNIEMLILDGQTFNVKKTVPIAIGGGLKNRVNLNTKPALTFDETNRLWISYENNRNSQRLEDGDNYTGDRCCAILSYQDENLVENENLGRWLFSGENDHKPTFIKDINGRLFLATHCGGNFTGNPHWRYRISWLNTSNNWVEPVTILQTSQKGALIPPAITFDRNNKLWLATCLEKIFDHENLDDKNNAVRSRLAQLTVQQLSLPNSINSEQISFKKTKIQEFLADVKSISQLSGHPKITGKKLTSNGEVYQLVYGNLHEHSESSSCWPAGTEGTLHDDYRFGMFSESYDFLGITDHGYTMTEIYWRKNTRIADFYNDPPYFVAMPAMEWTLTTGKNKELGSVFGSGHYNIVFASSIEARKLIRNKQEVYNVKTPETKNSKLLWEFLHENKIDCITIPHHPADEVHPVDWSVYDEKYVPIVEMFQCRGNAEYPGCPREINLDRHRPNKSPKGHVNYALEKMKYKMGFIASGDHNSMGIGVAALWVKELSREGILEALRNKRCFATTGDKMIIEFKINGSITDIKASKTSAPNLDINIKGQNELDKVEILRNSQVIKSFRIGNGIKSFNKTFVDSKFKNEREVLYYYIRATQKNKEIGWSSPIWIEPN